MASQLGFSEFNMKGNIIKEDNSSKRKRHNKTIKKKNKKVENFLNSMNNLEPMENEEDSLAKFETPTFEPPPQPIISQKKHIQNNSNNDIDDNDNITNEYYSSLNTQDINQAYYNQYIPYYEQTAQQQTPLHSSKDELINKLNYMIQLMEENKDEKTENITEELVLYMFLGIFVIFVVDSFARAGKYTR